MDQDIIFQHKTAFASGATTTTYFRIPYWCTVREITGIVQAAAGNDAKITVTYGETATTADNALDVLTFATGAAVGAIGTWVADATIRGPILGKDSILKFVTSDATAAADCDLNIELDPYAR